jgi:hypothetical protein
MPESSDLNNPASLSNRFDEYGKIVEGIVLRGLEHPSCELKRSVTLSKGDLSGRLEFVKFFQGHANSHSNSERLIVVGADEKECKFYDVENSDEFDAAKLTLILQKYLDPEPSYEVFPRMRASTGERYVLIVLHAVQARPIMMVTDGGSANNKVHFRPGDIWIKKNTSLGPATKADLDLMYAPKIELEAETRARQRFEHFREALGPALLSQEVTATPVPELLVGSRERLVRFADAMIASGEPIRFNMLLEMARERLVEKWAVLLKGTHHMYSSASENERTEIETFYRDEFKPALVSVIDVGLQIVKFDGKPDWFGSIANLLVEAFEASSHLQRLVAMNQTFPESLEFGRPAYEIYLGARTLAVFAIHRKRFKFIGQIQPRYVWSLSHDQYSRHLEPILFQPFGENVGLPNLPHGRNFAHWDILIGETWGEYFGTKEAFLSAGAQLEFVLELNSYMLVVQKHPAIEKFKAENPKKLLMYRPDFWATRLALVTPIAEWIYDELNGPNGFPLELALEPQITKAAFTDTNAQQRSVFFGEFLTALKKSQAEHAYSMGKFSFQYDWSERLKIPVDQYLSSIDPKQ